MKKIVATFLVLTLMAISIVALAETINFSSYTDDDLLKLLTSIQQEIANRGIEKTAELQPGNYIVGKDIPSGSFLVSATPPEGKYCTLYIFSGTEKSDSRVYHNTVSGENPETYHISLLDGQLVILDYPVTITIESGLVFQ